MATDDLRGNVSREASDQAQLPSQCKGNADTAGLKCAPDSGPNVRISTVKNCAPVGMVLHSNAKPRFRPRAFVP